MSMHGPLGRIARGTFVDLLTDRRQQDGDVTPMHAPKTPPPPTPVDSEVALAALTSAQQRAAEKRLAAERLMEEARALEERLSAEAEKARNSRHRLVLAQLTKAVERADADEREAEERVRTCAEAVERAAIESADAERRAQSCRDAEAAARADLEAAAQLVAERRDVRTRIDAELQQAREQAGALGDEPPSLAVVEELNELEAHSDLRSEAAKRIAERRAADAARSATG